MRPWCPSSLAAVVLLATCPVAIPHDGDPKASFIRPAQKGRGYRGAWTRAAGVPLSATASGALFPAQGVELLAWMPVGEFGDEMTLASDCWGYASPSGREYAILCLSHGTAFVEVTQPSDPEVVAVMSGPPSVWRDVKTYQDHAYVVSEGGSGVQVFDLSMIDEGKVTHVKNVVQGGDKRTHNVFIDEVSGFLYRCGGGAAADIGLRIHKLDNPKQPSHVATWSDRYVHDVQVVTYQSGPHAGRQIAFAATGFNQGFTEPGVDILDVTNKNAIVHLTRVDYPGAQFAHQCWLSEDRSTLYVNDELDEIALGVPTTLHLFDVSQPASAAYVKSVMLGNTAVGHNTYVEGDRMYAANYSSGLRVYDIADPMSPAEVAWFDTMPETDAPNLNSLWGNYPWLPSGVVIGSDREKGLFVWWADSPELAFTYPGGAPTLFDPDGEDFTVHIDTLPGASLVQGSPALHVDDGSGLETYPLVELLDGDWRAHLPPTPCGVTVSWYVSALSDSQIVWKDPAGHGGLAHRATAANADQTELFFEMEDGDGWTAGASGDDATGGLWERGAPHATAAQPGSDHTPGAGTDCWFTGQGLPGGDQADADVDGGTTTLESPDLDLSGVADPWIEYWRWFHNAGGPASMEDVMLVEVSDDAGLTWTTVEVVGPQGLDVTGFWRRHAFRVRDLVGVTSHVRLRFSCSDLGSDSLVEAAVDDVRVLSLDCPDCNENGISDDLELLQGSALDLNGDGSLDDCDPLFAYVDQVSVGTGGIQLLFLDGGDSVGGAVHLLLGSLTGTSPGIPVSGLVLPLAWDSYTHSTLANPNALPLVNSFGLLDGDGGAVAAFQIPSGSGSLLVGMQLWHAWVALDPVDGSVGLASNAVRVELVP